MNLILKICWCYYYIIRIRVTINNKYFIYKPLILNPKLKLVAFGKLKITLNILNGKVNVLFIFQFNFVNGWAGRLFTNISERPFTNISVGKQRCQKLITSSTQNPDWMIDFNITAVEFRFKGHVKGDRVSEYEKGRSQRES